jgi:hypothetical protein
MVAGRDRLCGQADRGAYRNGEDTGGNGNALG